VRVYHTSMSKVPPFAYNVSKWWNQTCHTARDTTRTASMTATRKWKYISELIFSCRQVILIFSDVFRRSQQYNNNNWPAPHNNTKRPDSYSQPRNHPTGPPAQYRPQQPMTINMTMERSASTRRTHKPEPIKLIHQTHTHRPVIVQQAPQHRQIVEAQSAVFCSDADSVSPRNPLRRDSNGVSEFGSEDGDSPGFRNYKVSPREVSPLQQSYSGYQSWPVGR
jgi:hypothetical protein